MRTDRHLQQQIFSHHWTEVNKTILRQKLPRFISFFFPEGIQLIKFCVNRLQETFQTAHTFNWHCCLKIPLDQDPLHHAVDFDFTLKMLKNRFGFKLNSFCLKRKRPKRTDRLVDNKTYVKSQKVFRIAHNKINFTKSIIINAYIIKCLRDYSTADS